MDNRILQIKDEIQYVIKGKEIIIDKVLAAIFAKGHILLEDIPGVGKTTLALALSRVMSLRYRRAQFTPDILPSDIVGFSLYNKQTGTFEYQEGPVLSHLFLADEINRTSPKTQSALLEVMEEGQVTVDGVSHPVPNPFTVIATQNPFGSAGTQRLPESQLDRFMLCLTMGYPDHKNAIDILKGTVEGPLTRIQPIISSDEVCAIQDTVSTIHVDSALYDYMIDLTEATRNHPDIQLGVSPRGSIALLRISQAIAYLRGRDYVIPDDILYILPDVFGHRIVLSARSKMEGHDKTQILQELSRSIPAPGIRH